MMVTARFPDAHGLFATRKRAVLFLRWVVIIVTSYLLLFDARPAAPTWAVPLFVVLFLSSNLVAGLAPERRFGEAWFQCALIALDTVLVSSGMILAGQSSSDLFLLYFSVLFLAALGESLAMIMGGCLLIVAVYVLVLLRTGADLLSPGVLLRFPFLIGTATFYGYLVELAKVERRRAQLALEHEKFRTDFLATVIHDLQSPLSAIAGFIDLLLRAPSDERVADYGRIFEAIKRGASECSELVANFLAMARGEARPQQIRRQVVDLNAVAEEVRQRHEQAAAGKDVRIELRLAGELPPLHGDRPQIRRAVSNLVGNAVKFVRRGGCVEVHTEADVSALILSVIDDGPGIAPDLQKHLFELYGRGDADASGSGLGLFIVRLVAEAHGGSVSVNSRPGQGARFTLRLPLPADTRAIAQLPADGRVSTIARPEVAGDNQLTIEPEVLS